MEPFPLISHRRGSTYSTPPLRLVFLLAVRHELFPHFEELIGPLHGLQSQQMGPHLVDLRERVPPRPKGVLPYFLAQLTSPLRHVPNPQLKEQPRTQRSLHEVCSNPLR